MTAAFAHYEEELAGVSRAEHQQRALRLMQLAEHNGYESVVSDFPGGFWGERLWTVPRELVASAGCMAMVVP
jgi:hypothetical protein